MKGWLKILPRAGTVPNGAWQAKMARRKPLAALPPHITHSKSGAASLARKER